MDRKSDFERRIDSLDTALFAHIASQTTDADKRTLLAIQRTIRRTSSQYAYLEIGSHLGGTIQPYLLDPSCFRIYSIDSRPTIQPDERGVDQAYVDNSTGRMLEGLRSLASDEIPKIVCFDSQSKDVDRRSINPRPQVCFIDGEHTNRAAASDFDFCLSVVDPDGVIIFHDADLVYQGIRSILAKLRNMQVRHMGLKLDGSVYAISLGNCPVAADPSLKRFLRNEELYFFKSSLRLRYRQYRNRVKGL